MPLRNSLFRACDPQKQKGSVLKQLDAVQKEVAVDRVEIKIDIDAVFAPARFVLCLMNNCSGSVVRNRHPKLGGNEDKELAAIMNILCNPRRCRNTPTRIPLERPYSVYSPSDNPEKKNKDFITTLFS